MNSAEAKVIDQAVALHKQRRFAEAGHLYNMVLNRQPQNTGVLALLSDLYLRQEMTGLAANLLHNLLEREPRNGKAWNDLGIAHRKENRYAEALACYEKSLQCQGDTVETCSNIAGLYADRAEPEKALAWCDRALAIDPNNPDVLWHKGLAMLTLNRWSEGWPLYEARQKLDGWDCRASVGAPVWDFEPTEHLYIHGEQGVGDEVMFLSCLPDVIPLARHITLEVNPAVAQIVRETWPHVNVVIQETAGDYTAKIALASLAARLRRDERAFPGDAFLSPFQERVELYRERLQALGPRPWIAVTWLGGVKATRVEERSIALSDLRPILDRYTCVSAQYEHVNPVIAKEREQQGLAKLDDDCIGRDIAAQAALFLAVDAVVTVQQTAVHVAGAVGAQTFAMLGQFPHWRYGISGERLPWYKSVKLYRSRGEWAEVINRVERDIANQCRVSRAKPAATQRAA